MGCDYYVKTELVIEHLDSRGRLYFTYTNFNLEKGYIHQPSDYDSGDNLETDGKKYKAEIQRRIEENTYNKVLFENNEWIKESYKKNYEDMIKRDFKEITNIKKIYKKITAWERN